MIYIYIYIYYPANETDCEINSRNTLFKLLMLILIGSLPIMIVGYILYSSELIYILRDLKIIAWTTLVFGFILYFADKNNLNRDIKSNLNLKTRP